METSFGEDHISIYLAVSGASPFQLGGEIHAAIRFCLYDQICDRYLTEQGRVKRFHALKTEWGVPRYMPLKTFTNPSNGYLVDDTCIFGVEVFVLKSSGVGECLTLKESTSYTHIWKVTRVSSLGDETFSDVFTFGDHKWKMWLFPRGDLANRGQNLSIFLVLAEADKLASVEKVTTTFTIWLIGRKGKDCYERKSPTVWLSSSAKNWGWPAYMPLRTFRECLMDDDSCFIGADVTVLGTVSKLP